MHCGPEGGLSTPLRGASTGRGGPRPARLGAANRTPGVPSQELLSAIRRQGYYGRVTPVQQVQLTTLMLRLLDTLNTGDAFVYQAVLRRLRNVCNLLGEPMPDPALIGRDRHQLSLPLGGAA